MYKIAVLVSGSGTDLQSIIDAVKSGYLNCTIEAVISDREGIYALERAKLNNIKTYTVSRKIYKEAISDEILKIVDGAVDLIVLAGWLSILKGSIIDKFDKKMINIHPSLIPAFCGSGMYGMKVHSSVIEYGVKYSGCTVHFVEEGADTGRIIMQEIVPVGDYDTPKQLAARVLIEEHKILPEAIKLLVENKIVIDGRRVILK
jgi:phosphoribosylglycinamide formyltransferase 1